NILSTLDYIVDVAKTYPELEALSEWVGSIEIQHVTINLSKEST
ncbi:phosphotransferase, partial [Pseudoalteromonas sp. S1731]